MTDALLIASAIIVAFILGLVVASLLWFIVLKRYVNMVENYEVVQNNMISALGATTALTKEFLNADRLEQER